MNPEIVRMLMEERTREQRDAATAWRAGRVRRSRRLLRLRQPARAAWKTRAA